MKKLYKSRTDSKIAGVCGGLGEFLNIDSTLIRVIWALFSILGGGLVLYIICAIIMPEDPGVNDGNSN